MRKSAETNLEKGLRKINFFHCAKSKGVCFILRKICIFPAAAQQLKRNVFLFFFVPDLSKSTFFFSEILWLASPVSMHFFAASLYIAQRVVHFFCRDVFPPFSQLSSPRHRSIMASSCIYIGHTHSQTCVHAHKRAQLWCSDKRGS